MSNEDVMNELDAACGGAVSAARDALAAAEVAVMIEGAAYSCKERREAAEVNAVGKYEPKLTENGIPVDVLAKLLPGDDIIELSEPTVAGRLGYRFVKRVFDMVSCGCALVILAIPMGVIALKIKSDSPARSSTRSAAWARAARSSTCTSLGRCTSMPKREGPSGREETTRGLPPSGKSCAKPEWTRYRSSGTSSRATSLCAY